MDTTAVAVEERADAGGLVVDDATFVQGIAIGHRGDNLRRAEKCRQQPRKREERTGTASIRMQISSHGCVSTTGRYSRS